MGLWQFPRHLPQTSLKPEIWAFSRHLRHAHVSQVGLPTLGLGPDLVGTPNHGSDRRRFPPQNEMRHDASDAGHGTLRSAETLWNATLVTSWPSRDRTRPWRACCPWGVWCVEFWEIGLWSLCVF